MFRRPARALLSTLALLLGIALLAITLLNTDLRSMGALSWQLGAALPVALVPGAVWHCLRTSAWRCCFPAGEPPSFTRLFRVRLAAEAFSFVTIRGVAGEPLKVALLHEVPPAAAAAAVALERVAYIVVTVLIVGAAAAVAVVALPLSHEWMRVFRGLAIGVGCLVVGLVLLLLRREPVPDARQGALAEPTSGRMTRGLRRFGRELHERWRELVYGDRRRLAVLLAVESAAYLMMALEVWVVLRATRAPITMAGAMAIETVTRVASMLSAFIPGGVGVLEASNVAAAAAVHASGGAAALAIVRRLRGLIWCAAGFAVAPGAGTPATTGASPAPTGTGPVAVREPGRHTLVVIDEASREPAVSLADRLGGLPLGERIVRAAVHAGYVRLLIWSPARAPAWQALARRHAGRLKVITFHHAPEWDRFRDALPPDAFDTQHVPLTRDALASAERALRASIVKPTDGRLARFNRRLSTPSSVWLIRWTRLSANMMSVFVLALGLAAGWLFSRGDYASGVIAAAISLAASILDGCDGELARLQFHESAFGCWLDTLGDYVYYVATFSGLTIGAVWHSGRTVFWWVGGALLLGAFLTFALLILLRHRATAGRPERLHATAKAHFDAGKPWARLAARLSTCATRATMPYGILAFALVGQLPVVLLLGAIGAHVYWISLAVELRRLLPGSSDLTPGPAARPTPAASV
jgi:uncharacterized protein (TIRG00374 family)